MNIVFDFDGTLVDSRALIVRLYNEMAAKHRFRIIGEHDLALLRTLSIHERIERLGVPPLQIPKLAIAAKQRYEQHIGALHIVPGMRDVIESLAAKGHRLSILSSNSSSNIRQFLKNNKIQGAFKEVVSAKTLFGKHHSIRKLLRQGGLSASQVVYVGDELRDIEACKKLAVPIIAVTWGYDARELLHRGKPDYIAATPAELKHTLMTLTLR